MEILSIILSPITWTMRIILDGYLLVTGSVGFSILLLSFTFAFLLIPFRRYALIVEARLAKRAKIVAAEVAEAKKTMRGENLFFATEEIYQRHGYHPIQNISAGFSFAILLPVLISAIILFNDNQALIGTSYLVISDLGSPDGLWGPINLLPIFMSVVTLIDCQVRYKNDQSAKVRFLIVAVVLLVLVYSLPSGLVLYWTGSNLFSLFLSFMASRNSPGD